MTSVDLEVLKQVYHSGAESLGRFEFIPINPLFWFIILFLFAFLYKFWSKKHAFSFSMMAALILMATTEIEFRYCAALVRTGEVFDPGIIRLVALVSIALIFMFYTFLMG